MSQELIKRLQDESDLCRNEGADDIAKLLHKAAWALHEQDADLERLRAALTEARRWSSNANLVLSSAARLIEQQDAEIERLRAVIERCSKIMRGGEGVADQGEAWDLTLQTLDAALAEGK